MSRKKRPTDGPDETSMTETRYYFHAARGAIHNARMADKAKDICEARRCRFLAAWFLEYRRKLISRTVPAKPNSNHEGQSQWSI